MVKTPNLWVTKPRSIEYGAVSGTAIRLIFKYGIMFRLSRVSRLKSVGTAQEARLQDKTQREDQAPARGMRADAQRNEDAVLEAAKEVFATIGVDAPVREIAARANVGVGTLYRRFPKRSDLVAAVFRREVDGCAAEAEVLAADNAPDEALRLWLMRYTQFLATKKGLAAALHSGDPAFGALPDYFRSRFEPCLAALLQSASTSGHIRADIGAYDLLRAIGNLSVASCEDGRTHTQRMVGLLIDGMRYGATPVA
jgi:AcrR family transcriptional regulator